MCGRFTLDTPISELAEIFGLPDRGDIELPARYNIAPTQPVLVIRRERADADPGLALLRWGLLPGWVKDPGDWPLLINARAETLGRKPAFEDAFRFRRCLVPADGFYEWRRESGGRQPYYVRNAAGGPLAFAGLWERWVGPDEVVESCTIVTTDANELLEPIHDRMPAILDAEGCAAWMDPRPRGEEALAGLLRPYRPAELVAYPVGRAVNRTEVDGPACIEPLEGREEWRGEPPAAERAGARGSPRAEEAGRGGEAGDSGAGGDAGDPGGGDAGSARRAAEAAPHQLDLFRPRGP